MDDLLDLNWSSPSTSNTSPKPINPLISSAAKPATAATAGSFDFLANSSNTSTSRGGTPNYYSNPSSTTPRISTPLIQPKPAVKAQGPAISNGGDAFSSLLRGTSSSTNGKNMTMAQKQAQMIEEKRLKEEKERQQFAGLGNWEQFGSGSTSTASLSRGMGAPLQPIPTKSSNAFEGLLKPTPSSSSSRSITPAATSQSSRQPKTSSLWDDDDFLAGPSSSSSTSLKPSPSPASTHIIPKQAQSQSQAQATDPWDFDQLAVIDSAKPRNSTNGNGNGSGSGSGMRTPDPDFDFGEWKDEEDVSRGQSSRDQRTGDRARDSRIAKPTRSSSPPPHIVGQIVEMGFSPAQARSALAQTSSGVDVQAALDSLLASAFQAREPAGADDLEEDDDYVERERRRREEEEKERRRRRRQGPSRDTIAPRSRDEREGRSGTGTPIPQADQILAQASEIGQSVFTKATSLWNTGKEKALKAYEEQKKVYEAQLAEGRGQKGKVTDGRPRWMVEAEAEMERDREEIGGPGAALEKDSGFRDDDDEEEARPVPSQRVRANGNGTSSKPTSRPSRQERPVKVQEASLFGDDPLPQAVPRRRPVEPIRATRTATPPTPLPARPLVSADPSAVRASSSHKIKGNEHFKLGRFTEAESAYTSAISQLPEGHLYLIPLYNNRAATRIKLGESGGATVDCTAVITIIGPSYHPSKEGPLPHEMANEVKLSESFAKALTKRAQAWEMGEKWHKAVEDWEKVLGLDAAILGALAGKTRNLAAEGLRRCKQMIEGAASSITKPAARPKPPVAPKSVSKPAQVERSEAVSTLRAAAKALEAEDQQRLQLKDSVEGRVNSWKNGKETNLRALLASLDTVLWDEILAGGLKVGMHELITEKQVKIKYMKVIARLHPDKLDIKKTTVEQRMLANGAFGTLNEAWQAFNNA